MHAGGTGERRCTFINPMLHERSKCYRRRSSGPYQEPYIGFMEENKWAIHQQSSFAATNDQIYSEHSKGRKFHLSKWRRVWGSRSGDKRPSLIMLDWASSTSLIISLNWWGLPFEWIPLRFIHEIATYVRLKMILIYLISGDLSSTSTMSLTKSPFNSHLKYYDFYSNAALTKHDSTITTPMKRIWKCKRKTKNKNFR